MDDAMFCEVNGCLFYSDFDVYFEDGSILSLCAKHNAVTNHPSNPDIVLEVPKHEVSKHNRPIKET